MQTHFILNAKDPRSRTVAEDPPPLPSPSSSTAIVDVDRDSPAQSFIGNPRSSPPAPLFAASAAPFFQTAAATLFFGPVVAGHQHGSAAPSFAHSTAPCAANAGRLCVRLSPLLRPRSSAASRMVASMILRRRWLGPAPPPPLLGPDSFAVVGRPRLLLD
ncbi:hypothetical protein Syun_029299 [Stephania yunnanensis]|uniref:Uncharacterized protein n=1 Tax=Stephania yunnanensis TaxID=152371 RepID=A0AAP0E540_9MAGN